MDIFGFVLEVKGVVRVVEKIKLFTSVTRVLQLYKSQRVVIRLFFAITGGQIFTINEDFVLVDSDA